MNIPVECTDVPPGKLATIVTSLEMYAKPGMRPSPAGPYTLRHIENPELDWYRRLYDSIGRDWLWFTRVAMTDDELSAILHSPDTQIHALSIDGHDEGLLELDFGKKGACELSFFGVTPAWIGRGAGRFLMNQAVEIAWSQPIARFWVHTCTLDHPAALAFYRRSGFSVFRHHVEIMDDPRLIGVLPRDAAPQIPLLDL